MQPLEIKQAVEAKGFTMAQFARAIERSPRSVSDVMYRRTKSRFIATSLAKVINRHVSEVFPDVISYHLSPQQVDQRKQDEIRQLINS